MGYLFGGDTGQSQADVTDARKRLAAAMLQQGADSSPVQSGWEGAARMAQALMGGLAMRKQAAQQSAADAQVIAAITGQPYTPPEQPKGLFGGLFGGGNKAANPGATGSNMPKVDAGGNVAPVNLTDGEVYDAFMGEVSKGITNPYGLAAVAATGNAESGFSPGNVNRTWSDPSESGQPGTAGGIMSWRGPRYEALAATGDLSPAGQAKFFLSENPGLIKALNNAKSVEEAQNLMNRAWAFKGYDRPGGEAARRLAGAKGYLPRFQRNEVASLDPAAGVPAAPIQPPPVNPPAPPPTPGYVDPRVVAADRPAAPPMPPASAPREVASLDPSVGIPMPGAAGQMRASDPAQVMPPQAGPQAALPPLPATNVGPTPNVASVPPVDRSGVGMGGDAPGGGAFPPAPTGGGQQPAPVRLAQALDNASSTPAANPMANPRVQALVQAMTNPNASPQVRALAAQSLQTIMKPPEYGFQTLPDGTVLRSDPRTGTVAPIYQATPKPVEVNGRLVDPVSGKVIADYSDPSVSSIDGAVIDNRTGKPVYQSHKPIEVNGRLVDPMTGQQVADYSNPNVSEIDGALVDQKTGKVIYKGDPKGVTVQPGESLVNPQTGEPLYQGMGYKPEDVSNLRKEIQGLPTYKSYQQALPPYQSMVDTAKTDSKASDLNLVYGLGKIMDPNSVVREGEMVMVNNTSSLPDWLQGAINSVNGGSRLEPATRTAILNEARSRMTAYRGALDNDISQYRGIIGRRGMNEADVLPMLGDIPEVPSLTPAAGDIGAPPDGVPADVWSVMTPAERKLWQK